MSGGIEPRADRALEGRAFYSRLHEQLHHRRFAVTAELLPPRGTDTTALRRKARTLRGFVDGVNLTDNPSAHVRMASWAASLAVLEEGVEPIMQVQCRDRNRLALQSDLVGAASVGIPNVLLMTGDPPQFGDHPDAKGVFDLDSLQLLSLAADLRSGSLPSSTVPSPPQWLIGAVENPFAPPRELRAMRLSEKVAAGAQFIQTQFIFDIEVFSAFMRQLVDLGVPERCGVLAGVGPIVSHRHLALLQTIPGVFVPDALVTRFEGLSENELAGAGRQLCAQLIEQVRAIPGVAGVHVMASGAEESIPAMLAEAGIVPVAAHEHDRDGNHI